MSNQSFRRGVTAAALVVALSLVLSSCGGSGGKVTPTTTKKNSLPEFDAKSTMEAIQKRGQLIVGLPLNEPPFASRNPNTGAIEGFDIEIGKQIAKGIFGPQLENKVKFIELDSREREQQLEGNKVDIAMGRYEITVARKKFVDFAGPYYVAHQSVVVSSASRDFDSLLDLSGKKVCIVTGSSDIPALQEQAPGVDVSTVRSTVQECGVALKTKTVDAVVADYVDIQPLITDRSLSLMTSFHPTPYGIGIKKGVTDLRKFVNDLLDEEIADEWDELYERTVGETGAEGEQPPTDRY